MRGKHAWDRYLAIFTLEGQLTGLICQCMTARRCANVLAGGGQSLSCDRHACKEGRPEEYLLQGGFCGLRLLLARWMAFTNTAWSKTLQQLLRPSSNIIASGSDVDQLLPSSASVADSAADRHVSRVLELQCQQLTPDTDTWVPAGISSHVEEPTAFGRNLGTLSNRGCKK